MSTLKDVKDTIKKSVKITEKGKKQKNFSKSSFEEVATALLNEPNYTVEVAGEKGGKLVKTEVKPVEEFRKAIGKILQKHGVDKQEIAAFVENGKIDKASWAHPLVSAMIYEYIVCDKKFDFLPTEDFKASLTLDEIGTEIKEHRSLVDGSTIKVKTGAHKKLKVKSSAPKWLKEKVK